MRKPEESWRNYTEEPGGIRRNSGPFPPSGVCAGNVCELSFEVHWHACVKQTPLDFTVGL
jgi:hypothetical protein